MSELILKDGNKKEIYESLIPQIKILLDAEDSLISNLANITAALKESFPKFNWVGFYMFDGEKLFLGPFQGKVACTKIEIGKGVCGTAAEKMETIIVPDISKFEGHIVCDSKSKSEIVVPLFDDEGILGVLDIDSYDYNTFDEIDLAYLQELADYLVNEIF
jgi:GAF domain-containing protein